MYAAGPEHAQRPGSRLVLDLASDASGRIVTSSEVLQEVLNIFVRRGQAPRALAVIADLVSTLGGSVADVTAADVLTAASGSFRPSLSARDRIHIAVMRRLGIDTIISADKDFDLVPGIQRLDPLNFESWRIGVFEAP